MFVVPNGVDRMLGQHEYCARGDKALNHIDGLPRALVF
jgi:hypothetical protein